MDIVSSVQAEILKTAEAQTLALIRSLLDRFHGEAINYCHWKSNEHLDASAKGDTDLDILFDIDQKEKLISILNRSSFVKFEPVSYKAYHDIEDYLGLDPESGKTVHLHAHFKLTMGEPYLKGYQLNIERLMLGSRIYDPAFGIYRTEPALELVLLFCRQALKLRNRDKIKLMLKKPIPVHADLLKEYNWLRTECGPAEITAAADNIFPLAPAVGRICLGPFSKSAFFKLSVVLRRELRKSRLYPPIGALLYRWRRELLIKTKRKLAKYSNKPIVQKRVFSSGLCIAVLGADGSGKSTIIRYLQSGFGKKLDLYPIYFGSGGYIPLMTRLSRWLGRKPKASGKTGAGSVAGTKAGKNSGFIKELFKCLDAIQIARIKARNLRNMQRARNKGMIVICDRYPQTQVAGYNDGPRLQEKLSSGNPLFKAMAKYEKHIFSRFDRVFPDIVFKLIADAELLESRKPGQTALVVLEQKIEAIKQLRFPGSCSVVMVDVSRPLEAVLRTIKVRIWNFFLLKSTNNQLKPENNP